MALTTNDMQELGSLARAAEEARIRWTYDDATALMSFDELDDEFAVNDEIDDYGLVNDDDEFEFDTEFDPDGIEA